MVFAVNDKVLTPDGRGFITDVVGDRARIRHGDYVKSSSEFPTPTYVYYKDELVLIYTHCGVCRSPIQQRDKKWRHISIGWRSHCEVEGATAEVKVS